MVYGQWYIYLYLVDFNGKCRKKCHTWMSSCNFTLRHHIIIVHFIWPNLKNHLPTKMEQRSQLSSMAFEIIAHYSLGSLPKKTYLPHPTKKSYSWWFQPFWKTLVKMGSSSLNRGEHIKKNNWNHHPPERSFIERPSIVLGVRSTGSHKLA